MTASPFSLHMHILQITQHKLIRKIFPKFFMGIFRDATLSAIRSIFY